MISMQKLIEIAPLVTHLAQGINDPELPHLLKFNTKYLRLLSLCETDEQADKVIENIRNETLVLLQKRNGE